MKKTLCSTGLRWLWLAIAVVVLDLGTKTVFHADIPSGICGCHAFFNFTYAHNHGAVLAF